MLSSTSTWLPNVLEELHSPQFHSLEGDPVHHCHYVTIQKFIVCKLFCVSKYFVYVYKLFIHYVI